MRIVTLAVALVMFAGVAFGQSQAKSKWTPSRTVDGQPDLQGTWVNFDSTPFETPGAPPAAVTVAPGVNPPDHWANHDSPVSTRRVSMVVDPPDGKVPLLPWAAARRDYDLL